MDCDVEVLWSGWFRQSLGARSPTASVGPSVKESAVAQVRTVFLEGCVAPEGRFLWLDRPVAGRGHYIHSTTVQKCPNILVQQNMEHVRMEYSMRQAKVSYRMTYPSTCQRPVRSGTGWDGGSGLP